MPTVNAQTEELISQIERAFRGVERPQITLRVARGVDDHRWDGLPQLRKFDNHFINAYEATTGIHALETAQRRRGITTPALAHPLAVPRPHAGRGLLLPESRTRPDLRRVFTGTFDPLPFLEAAAGRID